MAGHIIWLITDEDVRCYFEPRKTGVGERRLAPSECLHYFAGQFDSGFRVEIHPDIEPISDEDQVYRVLSSSDPFI